MKPALLYQQLAVLLLTVAFLAQTFSKGFIIADYYANTAAYARNCINKTRPKMNCNGKCQMMKKIQEEEKKEQENAEKKDSARYEIIFSASQYLLLTNTDCVNMAAVKNAAPCNSLITDRSYDFFHPPQVA